MKKYIILFALLFAGFGAVNAQAEGPVASSGEIRPVSLKQLYDYVGLNMDQFKVIKTFYGDTNTERLNQLRVTTDEAERAAIEQETLQLRDDKIRGMLTPAQLVKYNELQQPDVVDPDLPADTGNENPSTGGGGQ